MKKLFIILGLFIFMLPSDSAIITGEVEYNAEGVRDVVFREPIKPLSFENIRNNLIDSNLTENLFCLLQNKTELNDRKIAKFSDGTYGVMYYNDPLYTWYYQTNGRLISFTYKESEQFPAKITRYKADGSVINTGLKISEQESYIFSPNGKLIAHWQGNLCFDENNNVIMQRKYN